MYYEMSIVLTKYYTCNIQKFVESVKFASPQFIVVGLLPKSATAWHGFLRSIHDMGMGIYGRCVNEKGRDD